MSTDSLCTGFVSDEGSRSVANSVALSSIDISTDKNLIIRKVVAGFVFLFQAVFAGLYCWKVRSWDDTVPDRCYYFLFRNSNYSTSSKGVYANPIARDTFYILLLLSSDFFVVFNMWIRATAPTNNAPIRVLWSLCLIWLPLGYHCLFLIGNRHANQNHFEGGENEDDWSLGQLFAVLMLAQVLLPPAYLLLRTIFRKFLLVVGMKHLSLI